MTLQHRTAGAADFIAMRLQAGPHAKFVGNLVPAESVRIAPARSILRRVVRAELVVLRRRSTRDDKERNEEAKAADERERAKHNQCIV